MKCSACHRECRSTSNALIAVPDGGLRNARVCGICYAKGVHIVCSVVAPIASTDPIKERRRESRDVLGSAVKKLRNMAKAYDSAMLESGKARAAGLEQAADILEEGDF